MSGRCLDGVWTQIFLEQIYFGPKNFWESKFFGSQNFLGVKIFWGSKFFGGQKFLQNQTKLEFDFKEPVLFVEVCGNKANSVQLGFSWAWAELGKIPLISI